jgi:RNA polymerase sigma-70 factor, ECF subfamily
LENQEWLDALTGPHKDRALAELRRILLKGLRAALQGWIRTKGREFDELAEDFVQEALVIILEKLGAFRGDSRFTTWAHKICVRVALSELRRKRWRDVSIEDAEEGAAMALMAKAGRPEQEAERSMLIAWLREAMSSELSDKQRTALLAVALRGMPLEEAARRLDTNRNALYKLLHDARMKLKARMAADGMGHEATMDSRGRS